MSERAEAAARALLEEVRARSPRDLHVETLAAARGAFVVFGEVAHAHARVWQSSPRGAAVIVVDERARATNKWRFDVAHEIGHRVLHEGRDAFAHCEGIGYDGGTRWVVEREADAFAVELLLPRAMVSPLCAGASATLDDVARVASRFETSLTSTALRFAELARAPCAAVLTRAGKVAQVTASASFRARVVRRRMLADALEGSRGLGLRASRVSLGADGDALVWLRHG